jgi:hypothetical protein
VLASGVAMLWWSWGTWPDVFVDFGRELYVPWQIVGGKTLYADIAYFNGPLSPYLNALWFRLFGVSLRTLALANIAILVGLTALLYWLFKLAGGRVAAATAGVLFLTVFACGQMIDIGNYNFICPYSHELTHGTALSLAALAGLVWYQRRRWSGCLALVGVLLGLVFLTKIEVFLPAGVAVATGLGVTLWAERPSSWRLLGLAALFLSGTVAPVGIALSLLVMRMPAAEALRGTFASWASVFTLDLASIRFYRAGMGLLDPAASVHAMLVCTGWYVAFFGPLAGLALLLRLRGAWRAALAIVAFVGVGLGLAWSGHNVAWLKAVQLLPVVMLVTCAALLVAIVRQRADRQAMGRNLAGISLAVFATLLLSKMILNVRVYHYGFALAMPATLLLVTALVCWVPALIERLGGYGGFFRAAALGAIFVGSAVHIKVIQQRFRDKTHVVGEGADAFRADRRGHPANWILDEVAKHVRADQTLAVLPEGVMLNFLARRENPTPYINFMPPELLIFGEERILASFQKRPPDFVVLLHKDTSEYGYQFFGRDYGRRLYGWVERNYHSVSLLGARPLRGKRFGILLLRRGTPP